MLVSSSALLGGIAIIVVVGKSSKMVGRGGRLTGGVGRHLGVSCHLLGLCGRCHGSGGALLP